MSGTPAVSAILPEDAEVPAGADRVRFATGGVNVYENDWRVAPEAA